MAVTKGCLLLALSQSGCPSGQQADHVHPSRHERVGPYSKGLGSVDLGQLLVWSATSWQQHTVAVGVDVWSAS